MGIQAPAEVKYRLIHESIKADDNVLNISTLCRIAGVSRSGYYAWVDAAPLRQSREEQDLADFTLIKVAYEYRGYKKGARSIYMRLLHQDPPVIMNLKKIRRLMKKYGAFLSDPEAESLPTDDERDADESCCRKHHQPGFQEVCSKKGAAYRYYLSVLP